MIQSTSSLHGGVVKDPLYLYTLLLARWDSIPLKKRGPVSVALPGLGMAETEEKTDARRGFVDPSSTRKPTTALELSVEICVILH